MDLGCGPGVTAEILDEAGLPCRWDWDSSPDMISIGRGQFRWRLPITSSIYEATSPDRQAVLAIGEVPQPQQRRPD